MSLYKNARFALSVRSTIHHLLPCSNLSFRSIASTHIMSSYKPSEHDGLKKDGTPDKRVSSEHGFGGDHDRASELGKQGGATSGSSEGSSDAATYKPSEHDGLKQDGTPDKRMSSEHGFGGDHERAAEQGSKGGKSS